MGEKKSEARAAQGYSEEEAAALLEFDEALLQRLLSAGSAVEVTAPLHTAVVELTDPDGVWGLGSYVVSHEPKHTQQATNPRWRGFVGAQSGDFWSARQVTVPWGRV